MSKSKRLKSKLTPSSPERTKGPVALYTGTRPYNPPPNMKWCPNCMKFKQITGEFTRKDGTPAKKLRPYCRPCTSEIYRAGDIRRRNRRRVALGLPELSYDYVGVGNKLKTVDEESLE